MLGNKSSEKEEITEKSMFTSRRLFSIPEKNLTIIPNSHMSPANLTQASILSKCSGFFKSHHSIPTPFFAYLHGADV